MIEKLTTLWPEIALLVGACTCLLTGLATNPTLRRATVYFAALSLITAFAINYFTPADPIYSSTIVGSAAITRFIKLAICGIGFLLLLVAADVPARLNQTIDAESVTIRGGPFEPGDVYRGEFFAFFLFSITGAMLCASASDLVWLFLALELTSLPTYVMVATASDRVEAQEAGVKYFFLGALAAAIFLYGFTLIYGATGFTDFAQIRNFVDQHAALDIAPPPLLIAGMVLAIVGVSFKIAAAPMHFYTADVYQGAASPVTAFLAFIPKTAGFVSLILLLNLVSSLSPTHHAPLTWLLWIMAAATMTVGNVLGLLQNNVKRVLAYSSIAHSGYMLVALLIGPALFPADQSLGNGLGALLFYLVTYALGTIGVFAVLASLRRHGQEAQTYDDLAGLGRRHPVLGAIMLVSVLSLVGLPPLAGFLGKIYLFGSAIEHGYIGLVIIAVLNTAVSAVYYLRIVGACYFSDEQTLADCEMGSSGGVEVVSGLGRRFAGVTAAIGVVAIGFSGSWLVNASHRASSPSPKSSGIVSTDHNTQSLQANLNTHHNPD